MKIEKIWLSDEAVWIRTDDGSVASELFANYPRLRNATDEQRQRFTTDDFGITWPELDEDLSFEGFFCQKSTTILYRIFIRHPELNASAVARRIGISQSLFAQYISGIKKPSSERMDQILDTIRTIGKELTEI